MKKEPGKYYKNAQSLKWLLRPKREPVLDWIDYNNENTSPERIEELRKRLENASLPKEDFPYLKDKKIKKKIVSLDKPQKPLPFNLDKWLDEIDPQWWILDDEVEPNEEAKNRLILKKKMKVAEGIETLLQLNRRLI